MHPFPVNYCHFHFFITIFYTKRNSHNLSSILQLQRQKKKKILKLIHPHTIPTSFNQSINQSIRLLQSAEHDGANEQTDGADAECGGNNSLDGDERGGVIGNDDNGGDCGDEGGDGGGGEDGGGEAGGSVEQAEQAELFGFGEDAELLYGRERVS